MSQRDIAIAIKCKVFKFSRPVAHFHMNYDGQEEIAVVCIDKVTDCNPEELPWKPM